jgi:hypothetical protein
MADERTARRRRPDDALSTESDRTKLMLLAAVAATAAGAIYGARTASEPGADGFPAFPRPGEQFGYRRAFRALGYATAIVGVGAAFGVHAVCSHLDAWTARDFAAAMHLRLAGTRERLVGALEPAGDAFGQATKRFVHAHFDRMIEDLQRQLFGHAGAPSASDRGLTRPPAA